MRKENIVHRDIKPNNILTFECDETTTYKLCDFGSARILKPNEEYSSIYGTPAYLHPDMFGKYYSQVLNIKSPKQTFTHIHELWSIGVTFYQVASGKLPFEPKNGRVDIKTMNKMIKEKPPGSISARQTDGVVEWSSELPDCEIGEALSQAVTPFLAALLQVSLILLVLRTRPNAYVHINH